MLDMGEANCGDDSGVRKQLILGNYIFNSSGGYVTNEMHLNAKKIIRWLLTSMIAHLIRYANDHT